MRDISPACARPPLKRNLLDPIGSYNAVRAMQSSDAKIIEYASRNRLLIAPVAAQIFLSEDIGSKRAYRKLDSLVGEGYLADSYQGTKHRILVASGYKYWTVGPEGQKLVNCPAERCRSLTARALRVELACLWFTAFTAKMAPLRLEKQELEQLLGTDPPYHNIPHFLDIDQNDQGPVIWRAYVTTSDVAGTIRGARNQLESAFKKPVLRRWIERGDYGWVILCESPSKAADVQHALNRRHGRQPALAHRARFIARLGPSPATLKESLELLRKKSK